MTEITQDLCDRKKIFPKHQYGFQKNTSTIHALFNFQNTVIGSVYNGISAQMDFLFIEKAFDTVWFDGLVFKMKSFGLDISICRYILNFASQRKFAVKINDEITDYNDIPNGITIVSC